MMTNEEAKQLIKKYNAGQCNEEEKSLLDDWLLHFNEQEIDISQNRIEEIGESMLKNLPGNQPKPNRIKLWPIIAAVASVGLITIGTWMYYQRQDLATTNEQAKDIPPGGNKAILTLADGKTINLSDAKTGIVIAANKLAYNDGTAIDGPSNSQYGEGTQTISTPKGGQYEIVLPDGTKVWLNAATVLQFPANLKTAGERKIKLIRGEAYFEVFKDKHHPFVVTTGQQEVLVLGTHFNINAYATETKTTLIEGSVKLIATHLPAKKTTSTMLKPGEQSINKDGRFNINKVDVDLEIAWKNGKTEFRDADLRTIMQMLERWYNIETIYLTDIPDTKFSGSVSRTRNISEILELLESTDEVHFKIKGRRVEILK